MKEQRIKDIIGVLKIKRDLLSEMLSAAVKAADKLSGDDTQAFDLELQHCEDIMRMVDELGETEKILYSAEADNDADVKQLKAEIVSIVRQLSDVNKECTEASEAKLKKFSSQIKALRQTKQGIGAYAGQAGIDAVFIDAKK